MDALEEYSKELGLSETLTVEKLINSHREIRKLRLATESERAVYVKRGFDQGYKSGIAAASQDLIPISKLCEMTVFELATLISGYGE